MLSMTMKKFQAGKGKKQENILKLNMRIHACGKGISRILTCKPIHFN
jgi:hypothetical protein